MLESIIKKYLLESRRFKATVQAMKPVSEFDQARKDGAIYAFEVVYTIKLGKDPLPTETDVLNTLPGIISADSTVGAYSKYAKAENKYVLSVNLKDSERRMKWNVWIVPSTKKIKSTTSVAADPNTDKPKAGRDLAPEDLPEVPVTARRYTIGASTLVQFKQLTPDEQAKYKNMNEGQPFTAADIKAAPVDQPEEKEIINKPEVEKGVAIQNLFASPTSNATISTQETEKITTPYLYYQQPDGNNLYTMSYTDPYLYTYMDNAWYTINKLAWNSKKDTTPIRIKNVAAIAKLNATFEKTAVEPTAPVAPAAIAYKKGDKLQFKQYDVEYPLWFIKDGKVSRAMRYDAKEKKQVLANYMVNSNDPSARNNIYLKYQRPYGTKKSFITIPQGTMWIVDNDDIKRA
jgi:hypothetical protein